MSDTKKELLSGVLYTAISKYSGIIISLVVAGILARLIAPEEFGIVAIATVIIAFFNVFSDLGIAPAIIQNKELSEKDLHPQPAHGRILGGGHRLRPPDGGRVYDQAAQQAGRLRRV